MKPTVSVIITTHNRPQFLPEAIESVLSQDFKDLELIIVNDASSDGKTECIILKYKNADPRVKYMANTAPAGSTESLVAGLNASGGKYAAILDDDDAWICGDKIGEQVDFLETNAGYVIVGTNIIAVDAGTGREISRSVFAQTDKEIRKTILGRNPLAHSSILFRRDKALSLGGYDRRLKRGKDYDLCLKLGRIGKMAVLPGYCVKYRVASGSQREIIAVKKTDSFAKLEVIRRYSGDYPGSLPALAIETARLAVFSFLLCFIPSRGPGRLR